MAVLVLMYHRTPRGSATSDWDVPLSALRDQMSALKDAGVRFAPFKDAYRSEYYGAETFVSVTLDDGHESNLEAIDLLHEIGASPTAFIIRDYSSQGRPEYMTTNAIAEAGARCEFGGHGATHSDLTSLSPSALRSELEDSRRYLEDALQRPVTTMSAPGGRIDRRVVSEALACGYQAIGSSVELVNAWPAQPMHRVCMRLPHTPADLVRLATAGSLYWTGRHLRVAARVALQRSGLAGG